MQGCLDGSCQHQRYRSCAIYSKPGQWSCGCCCGLTERFNGLCLIIQDVEDGMQFCHSHKTVLAVILPSTFPPQETTQSIWRREMSSYCATCGTPLPIDSSADLCWRHGGPRLLPDSQIRCPFCKELILAEAKKCK